MLALRINRINSDWDTYWKALARQRAAAAKTMARTNHCAAPPDCTTLDRTRALCQVTDLNDGAFGRSAVRGA